MFDKSFLKSILLLFVILFFINVCLYVVQKQRAFDATAENAVSFSKVIANSIDLKEFEYIADTKQKTQYYYDMMAYFKENKESLGAEYVYVFKKIDDKHIEYVFDSNGDTLGEKDISDEYMNYFCANTSFSTGMTNSKYGTLISGYTPLIDSDGCQIGIVGVDFSFNRTNVIFMRNTKALFTFTGATILLYMMFTFYLLRLFNKKNDDTFAIYRDVVAGLNTSLSKKSDYTRLHSENVAVYSERLLKSMKKSRHIIETVKWGAILHDIGKIGIPGAILEKAGALTDDEFNLIKEHPLHSRDILQDIFNNQNEIFDKKELAIIAEIAEFHHERWDGCGYPLGLKNEEIPLYARIICVVDAYEAMTAKRPYKHAMSQREALREIQRCSGKQFDPTIVNIFIKSMTDESLPFVPRVHGIGNFDYS